MNFCTSTKKKTESRVAILLKSGHPTTTRSVDDLQPRLTPTTGHPGIDICGFADSGSVRIARLGAVEGAFLGRDRLPPER